MTQSNWHIKLNQTWKKDFFYEDWIVNYSLTLNNKELVILPNLMLNELEAMLADDISGVSLPRHIRVSH